jgi:hypothetical protein
MGVFVCEATVRTAMKLRFILYFILGIYSIHAALGADSQGRFAIRNAGMMPCAKFLEEKAKHSAEFNL